MLSLLAGIGTVMLLNGALPVRSLSQAPRRVHPDAVHAATPKSVFAEIPVMKVPALISGEVPANLQEVPFTHLLGKSESAVTDLYVVVDADEDTKTWKPGGFTGYSVCMKPTADNVATNDDWLISPAVHLESGKIYRVAIDCGRTLSSGEEEALEVRFGNAQTAEAMTEVALPVARITNKDFETVDADFSVDDEGYYYFGLHCLSEKVKSGNLKVCNFSVREATPRVTPAAAGTLTYEPGANGSLTFTCHYTAPAVDIDGEPIDAISKVEIITNWVKSHELTDVAPGETVDFETTLYNNGNNKIEAIAYRYDIPGESVVVDRIFAGPDDPQPVTGLKMTVSDDYRRVTLSWDPVSETGSHGGWVDASQAVYYIFDAFGSYYDPALMETTETTATFDYTDMKGQDFVAFQVTAGVGYYYSDAVSTSIGVVGEPDAMPWKESFADALYEQVWAVDPESSYSGVMCGTVYDNELQTNADDYEAEPEYLNSQDGDNGFFFVMPYEKDVQYGLFSGRVDISAASNPVLEFWYQGKGSVIDAMLARGDCNFETVRSIDMKEEPTDGWTRCRVPLDGYKDSGAVQVELRVRAIHNTDETTWSVPIDNIRIRNLVDCNVSVVSVQAPLKVVAGEDVAIAVTVENSGLQKVDGVKALLYCNGRFVDDREIGELAPDATNVVAFSRATGMFDDETLEFVVHLQCEGDMDEGDNDASVNVGVGFNTYPVVEGVKAVSSEGNVVLEWNEPEFDDLTAPVNRREDFESDDYEPFVNRSFGGWTLLDLDGGKTYTFLSDVNNPYRTQPMAFQLINPLTAGIPDNYLEDIPPHSGDNLLVGWSTNGQNDNWLISPELSGRGQTVTFWGRSFSVAFPEEFEILYSTGGKDPDEFVRVDNVVNYPANGIVPEEWTEFSFDVPEGSRYFALRHTAYDTYAIYLDDFEFEASGALPLDFTLNGYNVYRNGEKINEDLLAEPSHTDIGVENGLHTYHVTAVYNYGEARPGEPCEVDHNTTGVAATDAADCCVTALDGSVLVRGAKGDNVSVVSASGTVLFDGSVSGDLKIVAGAGVYMVKVSENVTKVVVK